MGRHEVGDYMPNWAFNWTMGFGWGVEISLKLSFSFYGMGRVRLLQF